MSQYRSTIVCPICKRVGTITRSVIEKSNKKSKERYQCRTGSKCCVSWKLERFYNEVMTPHMARLECIQDGVPYQRDEDPEEQEEEEEDTPDSSQEDSMGESISDPPLGPQLIPMDRFG